MKKALERTISKLSGDVSGLRGDVTGLRGCVTGLSGDVTGLIGDVDECGLTSVERKAGVYVTELVLETE